jgi:hypothetical protein
LDRFEISFSILKIIAKIEWITGAKNLHLASTSPLIHEDDEWSLLNPCEACRANIQGDNTC